MLDKLKRALHTFMILAVFILGTFGMVSGFTYEAGDYTEAKETALCGLCALVVCFALVLFNEFLKKSDTD